MDFKDKGVVGKGPAPEGGKADGEFFFVISFLLGLGAKWEGRGASYLEGDGMVG